MKKITSLIPVLFTLFGSGCASFGPTILIETEQPEEDFVVLCEWYKDGPLNIHGGMKQSDWKAYVTESGKEVDCGMTLWGGVGNARSMHPLYMGGESKEQDGIITVYPLTKLKYLDDLEQKYNTGYFKKFKWPESKYADYVMPVCGFPPQYIKYYIEAKGSIDVERFRKMYDAPMFECLSRTYEILKKYYRGFPDDADARKAMDETWRKLRLME